MLQVGSLLHGRERAVFGDAGDKRTGKRGRRFYIAEQRSKVRAIESAALTKLTKLTKLTM